jgi:hypothetical protein
MYCYLNYICKDIIFWSRRCGSPAQFLRGHTGAPAGHNFNDVGGDALNYLQGKTIFTWLAADFRVTF